MAKVIKKTPDVPVADEIKGPKTALIFGMNGRPLKRMAEQLEKEGLLVEVVSDEKKLLLKLYDVDPDLIFVEINAPTQKAPEDHVADIFAWMRARVRAINKFLDSPSHMLWQKSRVVLFKTESEMGATGSLGAEIADTDELILKCGQLGNVQYIGIYSFWSFMSKIRPLLDE